MSQPARLKLSLPPAVEVVMADIRQSGGRPVLVGGYVRDALLGQVAGDLDIEVYGMDPGALAALLARHGRVAAVGVSFGVLKFYLPGYGELDVSLPRRESRQGQRGWLAAPDPAMTPREAASRRDFTINAMGFDPATGELLDYFNGRQDLADHLLRHVGPAFADDPLRVLRAMQFAARWNFRLAPETVDFCAGLRSQFDLLALDRVWGEWHKLALKGEYPAAGLVVLEQTGWRSLFAGLEELANHQYAPGLSAWSHTLVAAEAAAALARRDKLQPNKRTVLLLATICQAMDRSPADRVGSDSRPAGEWLPQAFLSGIGCPHLIARQVIQLVRERAVYRQNPTPPAVRRLARRLAPASLRQWERLVAATGAGQSAEGDGRQWLQMAEELGCADQPHPPLLLGRHLEEAGLQPGPRFGRLLQEAFEAQLDGTISTVEEARAWLRTRLAEKIN